MAEPTALPELPPLELQSPIDLEYPRPVSTSGSASRNESRPGRGSLQVKPPVSKKSPILEDDELWELFDNINHSMEIIRYAICGLGSLIDHGFRHRRASRVTMLVPAEAKDVIKSWAIAHGGEMRKNSQDYVGIAMRDGSIRQVRVKYLDTGFDTLQVQQSRHSSAKILGLASQLEHIAAAYIVETQKCRFTKGGVPDPESKTVKTIVGDILWCLRRAAETRTLLPEEKLPGFLSAAFWAAFGTQYPKAKEDCARAGINIKAVLDRHAEEARMKRDIQEHDELMNRYGIPAMSVVEQQPGPFQGMRGLGRRDMPSIYTLRNKDSQIDIGSNEPPLPPAPAPAGFRSRGTNTLPRPILKRVSMDEDVAVSNTTRGPRQWDSGQDLTRSVSTRSQWTKRT